MKIVWFLMIIAFLTGMLSKILIGRFYEGMIKGNSNNPLTKQIKLKYDNCKKLEITISNVNVFVEKALDNYRFKGFRINGWNNLSKEMEYICMALGIINAIIFRTDSSAIVLGLGIGFLSSIAIKLLDSIVDTDNQKRMAIVELVDYLDNSFSHRAPLETFSTQKFSREASTEFHRLNKSFDKIQSQSTKSTLNADLLEEILEEYLT